MGPDLAARCEINFRPRPGDINAYGPRAAHLFGDEQLATLAGDLVAPGFRGLGLHAQMIRFRLTLLAHRGYSYAMCGIVAGNDASRDNYLTAGFRPIGSKDIDWGNSAVGQRSATVILYGIRLTVSGAPCE